MLHCVLYLADNRVRQRETRPWLWDQTHTYKHKFFHAHVYYAKLHRRFTHVLVTCVALTKVLDSSVVHIYQSQCWGLVRALGYTTATMVGGQMSWLALKQLCIIPWWWPGGHQHQPLAECPLHQSVLLDWRYRVDWHHSVQWESMKWGLLPVWNM